MKKNLMMILAAVATSAILPFSAWAAGASLTTNGTTITPGAFKAAVIGGGTYDGAGVTVDFTDLSDIGSFVHNSEGPQVYLIDDLSSSPTTALTIKNVKFDLPTSASYSKMQMYLYARADVTFENCVFSNVSVSMNDAVDTVKGTFKNCTFVNVKNYALKYIQNLEVEGCLFDTCDRAMMISCKKSGTVSSGVTISGCEFANITKDRIVKFYEFRTDENTTVSITGNTVDASSTASFITVDFDNAADAENYTYTFAFTGNTGITTENLNENNTEKMLYISSNSLVDDESAVVVAEPVTNSVQSANLFGAIKIESNTASNMYVAVPFEGFEADGAARKAKDAVHAANLTAGTKMFAWDKSGDKYNVYESEGGAWKPANKVTVNAEGKAVVETADLGYGVTAGTGVILQRPGSTGTVYVYGQIPATTASVTFEAGQTLVSPPYTNATVEVGGVKYVNLNAFTWTGVKGTTLNRLAGQKDADYIQFRNTNNSQIKYFYLPGKGWGVTPRQVAATGVLVEGDKALIPVGTAFWYYSNAGGAKVEWK